MDAGVGPPASFAKPRPDVRYRIACRGRWGRQTWSLGLRLRRGRLGCRRQGGLDTCNVGAEVFKAELQLVVIEPLCTPAKRLHIVWQGSKIDVHEGRRYAESLLISSADASVSQSAAAISSRWPVASAAPAHASPRRRSAARAVPSSRIASRRAPRSAATGRHRVRAVCEQAEPGAIPKHDLDEIGSVAAPEHEQVAGERILLLFGA
jgi:hypothetical protein